MTFVQDAGPMLAYLWAEPGAEVVRAALEDAENSVVAHAINLMEVFYQVLRVSSRDSAEEAIRILANDGVTFREDLDRAFWSDAGELKALHSIWLADCYCLALARRLSARLLTTDHHEMDSLVPMGICDIQFIR